MTSGSFKIGTSEQDAGTPKRGLDAPIRPVIQDETRTTHLTHHGLRNSFAAQTYQELTQQGISPLDASYRVSRLLGHERHDVTRIYLASVEKGGAYGE